MSKKHSFGLWRNRSSFVSYNLTVVVGTSAAPTTVTIQALDVNGDSLAVQSNLAVRLTTGVLPYVTSTNGTLAVATGTTVAEDEHNVVSGITAATWLKLQSNTSGLWSFTVTNTTTAQLMGLVIGPCEGSGRGDFGTIYKTVTVAGAATNSVTTGGPAAVTFTHAT
jgi:hypothetical protein